MVRNYIDSDEMAALRLWNTAGVSMGYAPLDLEKFRELLTRHPDFSPEHTFVLEKKGEVLGFANGCTGDHIPRGDVRGYVSCVILAEEADTHENSRLLLDALEASFRKKGRIHSAVTFFNPIRLPWIVPGTDGHQHNNCPGVAVDWKLHRRMLDSGYRESTREMAMYLDLSGFRTPDWVEEKARKMESQGYTVARYDPDLHWGLEEMVDALENPMWSAEIPAAGRDGLNLLVGLKDSQVAGFTGPVYPEPTGRGYFAGIGVAPRFEKHGLGTLLFYRLLEEEQKAGSKYMSLFTGCDNHARFIYMGAGFQPRREFGVMIKEIT